MPKVRWNDQRHLCGAYRDKRVVPYDRISVSNMTPEQRDCVIQIVSQYRLYLPKRAPDVRLDQVRSWFHETYSCWVGGYGDDDPFYVRIQSPIISVEFDNHSGVFLTNKEPAKFHIHTLLRTPNGGDYGIALLPLIKVLSRNRVGGLVSKLLVMQSGCESMKKRDIRVPCLRFTVVIMSCRRRFPTAGIMACSQRGNHRAGRDSRHSGPVIEND